MRGERCPHAVGVGFPPTGRTLNVGEQKRHHPRRSSRRISGHPRRVSHRTRPTSDIAGMLLRSPVSATTVQSGPMSTCLRLRDNEVLASPRRQYRALKKV
jgi:hypothetical protein